MEKKLRKRETLLADAGAGVILFVVWSIAKVNLYLGVSGFFLDDVNRYAEENALQELSTYSEWKQEPLECLQGPRPSSPSGSPRFTAPATLAPGHSLTVWARPHHRTLPGTRLPYRPRAPRPSLTRMPTLPWFSLFLRCPSPPGTLSWPSFSFSLSG